MKREHLDGESHEWACMRVEGVAGEIHNFTALDPAQIKLIEDDLTRISDICPPDSTIACLTCELPFNPSKLPQPPALTIEDIRRELIRVPQQATSDTQKQG